MMSRAKPRIMNAACAGAALMAFFALFALAAKPAAAQESQIPVIEVTGQAEILVEPDMALIRLGVREEAKTAGEASSAMTTALAAILAQLRAAGLEERDIATGRLRLDPLYDSGSSLRAPQVAGFAAEIGLTVTVRDLEALGAMLDAAIGSGANQIQGITFDISDRSDALDAARAAAVADGLRKAELYANAAGVALGDLMRLSEGYQSSGPQPVALEARSFADAGIPAGELTISAEVSMGWGLAP